MQKDKWIYAYASAIGNSHISENIPCQDYCTVENYDNYSIAIVCDGAGSCSNSQIGSKNVTEFCLFQFGNLIKKHNWNKKLPSQNYWQNEAKKTLRIIKEDLVNYSINNSLEFKSLSCTVIVTIVLKNGLLVTHIGDGRAGYCNMKDEWFSTITPFHGELANQTVFITSDIWNDENIDNYIESKVIKAQVKAFCLLSDGCEKASFECNLFNQETETYFDPNKPYPLFFNPNLKILPELHRQNKTKEEINTLWKTFLTNGNEKLRIEPDDKTMILGVRLSQEILIDNE
jgi:Protein phosphatase 2C